MMLWQDTRHKMQDTNMLAFEAESRRDEFELCDLKFGDCLFIASCFLKFGDQR